jgi:uncharacterized protein YjiS (DUF1127 family)
MNPSEMNISDDATQGAPPIASTASAWLARQRTGLGRLGASWTARRRRSREIQMLAAFSDRELWDLGLGRSDLQAILNGTYRRG